MAKIQHLVAVTGCLLLVLLFFQLQSNLDFRNECWAKVQTVFRIFVPLDLRQEPVPSAGDYVLGVGKADITGYVTVR